MVDPILPYMRQLPQDYYKNKYPLVEPAVPTEEVPVYYPPTVTPPSEPTDPVNNGGIWIGTIEPEDPGEGWLFFNTSDNTLYVYTDGNWEVVASPSSGGGIAEAPTDGGIYARQNSGWTSIYDGGSY
jgi:hypothetical protein